MSDNGVIAGIGAAVACHSGLRLSGWASVGVGLVVLAALDLVHDAVKAYAKGREVNP